MFINSQYLYHLIVYFHIYCFFWNVYHQLIWSLKGLCDRIGTIIIPIFKIRNWAPDTLYHSLSLLVTAIKFSKFKISSLPKKVSYATPAFIESQLWPHHPLQQKYWSNQLWTSWDYLQYWYFVWTWYFNLPGWKQEKLDKF